ncbi:MAG: tol-pal system-associated acyl-CoA thioesterase [Alphaproteobacteria bacterium]|nr:tol-pal system-associated acyl-CoA thioesterase [Alphaproteobacteria bacterium]
MTDPHIHRIQVRIYYEDTDFSGIVYHARYLHFLERGRTEALRSCGISHTDLLAREEPLAFAVRTMKIDWRLPAKIDDMLAVETVFREVRGARMFLTQAIRRDGALIAAADVEAACISLEGRARRLPPDVLDRLQGG